ncbi:MAG: hypothetical protein V7745_03640 [Pseudomonadales bacterium]
MKKVFVLILLVVAIVVGVKGFIYYKVTTQLDDAIALVSPFVLITYEDVSSSLEGEVNVEGVKIKAYGNSLELAIDDVGVKFPDLQTLMFIGDDLKKQRLPEQMKLTLDHVRMDLQHLEPYMMLIESQSPQPFQDYTLLGCGDLETASPLNVLQQLGYSELDSTLKLGYRWDRASKRFTIDSDFRWHEMTSSAVTIDIDQIAALSAAALMSQPELKRISVNIEDEGYNTRLLNHCAAEQNVSKDDFVALHIALMKTALAKQGISLSERVFDAYQYYLNAEGGLMLQMRPGDIQQLANLDMFKPSDIPDLLGLEIHMGDEVIRDIEFDWDEGKFKQTMATLIEQPKAKAAATESKSKPMQQEVSGPQFSEVNPSRLASQMHQTLRITTFDKRKLEGILRKITDERIYIDVPMAGGNATLPVRIADISLVKVLLESAP